MTVSTFPGVKVDVGCSAEWRVHLRPLNAFSFGLYLKGVITRMELPQVIHGIHYTYTTRLRPIGQYLGYDRCHARL